MVHQVGKLNIGVHEQPFPIPLLLAFVGTPSLHVIRAPLFSGYAIILLLDKVAFDAHAVIGHGDHHHQHTHDPVEEKLVKDMRNSFSSPAVTPVGGEAEVAKVESHIRDYLSKKERFSVKVGFALRRSSIRPSYLPFQSRICMRTKRHSLTQRAN